MLSYIIYSDIVYTFIDKDVVPILIGIYTHSGSYTTTCLYLFECYYMDKMLGKTNSEVNSMCIYKIYYYTQKVYNRKAYICMYVYTFVSKHTTQTV